MSRGTHAEIDLGALRHNLNIAKQHAGSAKVWSIIKANAYGHGACEAAKALKDISDGFGVAALNEAIALRESGCTSPIILLEGITQPEHLAQVTQLKLDLVVQCQQQLDWLAQCSFNSAFNVWVKIDTGMHRLGFIPEQGLQAVQVLKSLPSVAGVSVMTHYACADHLDGETTRNQIKAFEPFKRLNLVTSQANSAAIISTPDGHGDWVRPGIMLYGASPFEHKSAHSLGLKPVMNLKAPVISVRQINAGERVGYGGRWQALKDSVIATLAIGYGDGYSRHMPDGTPVFLNGEMAKIAGTVSMDMCTIDVSHLQQKVNVGDWAELWGPSLPVDQVAAHCGTIGYELLTRLMPRVEKRYLQPD